MPRASSSTGDTIVRRTAAASSRWYRSPSIRLLGRHLVADVLAAAAVASLAGVDADAMTRAVEGFTGLEHALEPVAEVGGVRFVNDSKATNIESARRAIESFDHGVVVILGGRFKGGDFARSAGAAASARGDRSSRSAKRGRSIVAALGGASRCTRRATCRRRCGRHSRRAAPGQTVVLAPACASFDMFRDYAERGRVFKQEVLRLKEEWNVTREQ